MKGHDQRPGDAARDSAGTRRSGGAAGKRTRTQRLPATAPRASCPAGGGASAPPATAPHEDPFALHLLNDNAATAIEPGGSSAVVAGGAASDAAEVDAQPVLAREQVGEPRPVAARAAPSVAVQLSRDETKARTDAFEGTAPAYVAHNLRHILHLIRTRIVATDWSFAHPRVAWGGDLDAVAAAVIARFVELAEAPAGEAFRATHLPPFWHPVDLWTVVDTNRHVTEGAPGQYRDGKPIAKGPLRRDEMANEAAAIEFVAVLRSSFARMVPRFVTLADDVRPAAVDAAQLVTSAPIDRLWSRVLADPSLVRHVAPTGAAGEAQTPTGPGVFRDGLRPVVLEWMGSQDLALWNVVRVTWPADATTEEVAATLYQYPGVRSEQSHNAFAIVNAAPFFVVPRTWAAAFPDAVRWASAEHSSEREQPIDAVLSSTAFNEAAVNQAEDEDTRPLARAGKAGPADTQRLAAMLWRGSDQVGFVAERLAPWKLPGALDGARAWLQRRAQAMAGETPAQIASWAPVIEAQQRLLTDATGAIAELTSTAEAAGVTPTSPTAGACRRALVAYVGAINTSHLADLGRARLAAADAARQQIALSFVDGALDEATSATESLREAEGGSYGPDTDAGDLTRQRKQIHRERLRLRAQALDGREMDGEVLEDLTINAGMVTVRARAKELAMKAGALSSMLESTEHSSAANAVAAAFDSSFDSVPDKLALLAGECQALEISLSRRDDDLGAPIVDDPAEQTEVRRRGREVRRKRLAQAQAELATIPARHGLDRLHREALDTISDNQIAALAINVVTLIAASIATSGLAAYAGGAARGFAAVRFGMSMERASMVGGAVNVGVDSVLTAAIQAGVAGDNLGDAAAENILANVGVRAALARFAPLMRAFDDEAADLWTSGGAATKGAVVMAKGAAVSAELVTAAGVSYVAQRLVRGKQPPADDEVTAWFIQGASMALGRMVATRTTQLHQRLDRAGVHAAATSSHAALMDKVNAQAKLALAVEADGDPDQAMRLLIGNRALLEQEAQLWRALDADPAQAAALGISHQERAGFARANADALADTSKHGMDVMPLRLAGVDEVVPGALWSGTSEQIATALHQARAIGLTVRVFDVGHHHKRWRVQLGDADRVLEIQERPTSKRAASKQARALLHTKAARELEQIRVTVAPMAGRSRGSYYVTPADGARMGELFRDLDGAEVIEFRAGLLLRHGGDEWYFEFNAEAHTVRGASRAAAIGADAGGIGLPASNVATVELWAFGGGRTIGGRDKKQWTVEEEDLYNKVVYDPQREKQKLLWAGHVGISMDGGKTIYGLTPDRPHGMSIGEFERALRANQAFPGRVGDDTQVFTLAREMAEKHGWNTTPERSIILMDEPAQSAIIAKVIEMVGMKPGEHGLGYEFPLREPRNGQPFQDSNGYAADCVANCAAFPAKVGVPIPEETGRMQHYVPELQKWIEGDAPFDAREPEEP